MAVVLKHLAINMAGDLHDGLVARPGLCKFGDERMPVVVPATFDLSVLLDRAPMLS
jgi:hypothetical protein